MVPFQEMVYVEELAEYVPQDEVKPGQTVLNISGTEFRRRLMEGGNPGLVLVSGSCRRTAPYASAEAPAGLHGVLHGVVRFPASRPLPTPWMVKPMELGGRAGDDADGDLVRKNLSSELRFSKEHRNINILGASAMLPSY